MSDSQSNIHCQNKIIVLCLVNIFLQKTLGMLLKQLVEMVRSTGKRDGVPLNGNIVKTGNVAVNEKVRRALKLPFRVITISGALPLDISLCLPRYPVGWILHFP